MSGAQHAGRGCREPVYTGFGTHSVRTWPLAMLGAPARTIQELAGHMDITTTQRYTSVDTQIRPLMDT